VARHNNRPPIAASSITPNLISLPARDGCVLIACPDCGVWRSVKRSMISAHREPPTKAELLVDELFREPRRCKGSGQRILIDLTFLEWRTSLQSMAALAKHRANQVRLPHTRRNSTPPPSLLS
jgi:hypothetical protein